MFEKIVKIVGEQLDVTADRITMETSFKEDLEADSLDLFELVSAIEDEFGVVFEEEELESMTNVKSVIDCLGRKGVE